MKRILIPFLLFASLGAAAKKHDQQATDQEMQPVTRQILQKQMKENGSAKPTQMKHRIVAYGYRRLDGGDYRDSSHYFYSSNTRGTVFENCIENLYLEDGTSRPDSFYRYSYSSINGLYLWYKDIYTYDTADNVITKSSTRTGKVVDHYNTDGTINHTDYYNITGDTLMSSSYSFYNGQKQKIRDSSYSFLANTHVNKTEYIYDAQSYLDSTYSYHWDPTASSWLISSIANQDVDINGNVILKEFASGLSGTPFYYRTELDYNAFNLLVRTVSYESSDGINYAPSYKDSIAYNVNNPVYTHKSSYGWNRNSSNWDITYLREYHLNAAGNWDTAYYYRIDQANNNNPTYLEKDIITYNSYGWVADQYGYWYDTATHTYEATPYDINAYYYEDYDDPTTIAGSAAEETVAIYPNPATEQLIITTTEGQALPVTLTDLAGRTVQSTTLNTRVVLDISMLPPGMYLLKAGNEVHKVIKR